MRGILVYGCAAEDDRALEFVRRAYEFTLTQGVPRMGWINCLPAALNQCEACTLDDLVGPGIRLSDAGLGDYWDDVEARSSIFPREMSRRRTIPSMCAAIFGCRSLP